LSLARLREHREIWEHKPVLDAVYRVWFDSLLAGVREGRRVLEVGAGPGFLAEHARRHRPDLRFVASDLVAASWNDFAADGQHLPVRDCCVDAILALDFLHHLERPATFFLEARRVLRPGGHVAVVEPWVTPLSYVIYRYLHEEGCRLDLDPWNPFPAAARTGKEPFQGDAAVVWRLVRDTPRSRWEERGFHAPRVRALNGFAYLASLGFRRAQLGGDRVSTLLRGLDQATAKLACYLGMRALVRWDLFERRFTLGLP
jgi:SAM-dependent methyltransferase